MNVQSAQNSRVKIRCSGVDPAPMRVAGTMLQRNFIVLDYAKCTN